jgi:hypothetical protein
MINNADVIERLRLAIGKELTSQTLHETLFCEKKHQKILQRFYIGKYNYIEYQVKQPDHSSDHYVADISLKGNPNTFRIGIKEIDGIFMIESEPRISFNYLSSSFK